MKPLNIQHPPQGILTVRAAGEGGGGGGGVKVYIVLWDLFQNLN